MPDQISTVAESETPLEVKQEVFDLRNKIAGKLDYLERENCPTLAIILRASMLQITPYVKVEKDPDGYPVPRWDEANENDLRILQGIDDTLKIVGVNSQELRRMISGIIQANNIWEANFAKTHPKVAREIREAETISGPEGAPSSISQLGSDQLIQALYELDNLVGRERTGSLPQ